MGLVVADRYRLMEVIGKGGHGLVYRGVERSSDREVAVKVLMSDLPQYPELEARLEREHEALVALEGTAALRVFGLHRQHGSAYLVTELLRGQDFDHYLSDIESQGERMNLRSLVEFIDPIVTTLEAAHDRGILHRDLKPGNIFILGRGTAGGVRLLDFGLSRLESSRPLTQDGIIIGSPSYIAPEVWEGNPRGLDHRADVYSLGAILYRAMAGEVPFPVTGLAEKARAAKTAPRPSLRQKRPELPEGIDAWVGQALAVDRERRFHRARAMWSALREIVRA
ncbi:MAG TPA: serine/threonine-protein kinase [Polyangiaceae bacterium]|nr:serine/threonine-protein kinase [Polyangiaceae bacterium]